LAGAIGGTVASGSPKRSPAKWVALFADTIDKFLEGWKENIKPTSFCRLVVSSGALKPSFADRLSSISAFDSERYKLERRKVCDCGAVQRWRVETGGWRLRAVAGVNLELTLP
jgi:hypothetical protein